MNERLKTSEELDSGASHLGSSETFATWHSVLGPRRKDTEGKVWVLQNTIWWCSEYAQTARYVLDQLSSGLMAITKNPRKEESLINRN